MLSPSAWSFKRVTFLSQILNRALLTVCLYTLSAPVVHAGIGLAPLRIETGPRATALGEAFCAVSADPLALRYNPAGAIGDYNAAAHVVYQSVWDNVSSQAGYLTIARGAVSYNLAMRMVSVTDIPAREDIASVDPLYSFESRDFALSVGATTRVDDKITVGGLVGVVMEKIDVEKGSALTLDIGAQYRLDSTLTLGLAANNIGGDVTLVTEPISQPTTVRVGGAWRRADLLFVGDLTHVAKRAHAHGGVEWRLTREFSLRAGGQSGYDTKTVSAGAGFTGRGARVDYAVTPYQNDFGLAHQFGVSFFFR